MRSTIRFQTALASAALALLCAGEARAGDSIAQLSVVATIPDLADIAREIGGERVSVRSIASGRENVHSVQLRPSDLIATSRADAFLSMGLSLEHAWVPGLLRTARNPRIQPGAPGFLNASEGWQPIQVPASLSRSEGVDIHPQGNPHFNLDPRAGRHLAGRVLELLCRCDPTGREAFEQGHAAYLGRLERAEARWARMRSRLAGKRVLMHHQSFDYFLAACGIECVATLEPKPGVPPTPGHLAQVIELAEREGVKVLLTSSWASSKQARTVADKCGARVVELPTMVGGAEGASGWIEMMELIHRRLCEAFEVQVEPE